MPAVGTIADGRHIPPEGQCVITIHRPPARVEGLAPGAADLLIFRAWAKTSGVPIIIWKEVHGTLMLTRWTRSDAIAFDLLLFRRSVSHRLEGGPQGPRLSQPDTG
jgi:hypothetical protein